jgi:1L-myo-inositol 1-phosphate cytidylyltransferase / CDP-L-myo-inositol myo-inositolphosphotransferase
VSDSQWVLVLTRPSGDPTLRIGGLPLCLRLCLDAQAAGAAAIVCAPEASAARPALGDRRLRLPVLDAVPEGARSLSVPATYLVHRTLIRSVVRYDGEAGRRARELATEPFAQRVPYGFEPIDVSGPELSSAAERALFHSLRKPEDGWTSRYLNRRLSLPISRLLSRTPLHPNQVSVVILGVGILGAVLAARGELVLGALCFQAQSVLDGCDGELSRVTHQGSLTGEWLDTVGDDITNYGFFGGAGYGLYAATGSPWYLAAGLVTVASGLVASAFEYRYLIKIGSGDLLKYPLSQATSKSASSTGLARLAPLFKRDTFVFLTLVAAVAGLLGAMLCLFAAAAVGMLFAVLRTELRLAREAAGAA